MTEAFVKRHDCALYRAASVRELDRVAIEEHGIAGMELMERAGAAAFAFLRERWPAARRIAVVCGPGNNGGDGFVLARLALERGLEAAVFLLGEPARLAGDAATAHRRLVDAAAGLQPVQAFDARDFDGVVDGLFGTGLARPLDGSAAALVEAMNRGAGFRLALDIPSGLSADTGNVLGAALRADATVSFIGLKRGLFTGDGCERAGDVRLADLGVPATVIERVAADAWRAGRDNLGAPFGPRPRRAHKGRFGHVLVIGGDLGFAGAARLCAEAAARTGAGLTSVATRPEHVAAVIAGRPELMVRGVVDSADLEPLLAAASVLAVGPGLGRSAWSEALLDAVLDAPAPMVLDADGLNHIAASPERRRRLAGRRAACVLTPHPGEAARLLDTSPRDVEADRFAAVAALAEAFAQVCVLKGAGTLVQAPGEPPWVCDAGNPGMASGGMGDVLTGLIAGLMAQGLEACQAAALGCVLHGLAADDAAAARGERGLLAGDLFGPLGRLVNRL